MKTKAGTPATLTVSDQTPPKNTRPSRPKMKSTAASATATAIAVQVSAELIARRAYELFIAEGAAHGRDVDHWLAAEHELRSGSCPADSSSTIERASVPAARRVRTARGTAPPGAKAQALTRGATTAL